MLLFCKNCNARINNVSPDPVSGTIQCERCQTGHILVEKDGAAPEFRMLTGDIMDYADDATREANVFDDSIKYEVQYLLSKGHKMQAIALYKILKDSTVEEAIEYVKQYVDQYYRPRNDESPNIARALFRGGLLGLAFSVDD